MRRLKLFLVLIFLVGTIGVSAELALIGHVEGTIQWVPFVLLGLAVLAIGAHAARPTPRLLLPVRAACSLLLVGSVLGIYFHLDGNAEFERERDPDGRGVSYWMNVASGATPALAPGALAQIGLIGLAYAWPSLHRPTKKEPNMTLRAFTRSIAVAGMTLLTTLACSQGDDGGDVADAAADAMADAGGASEETAGDMKKMVGDQMDSAMDMAKGALVDPNAVDASKLASLPGMTAERAEALVAARPLTAGKMNEVLADVPEETRRALYGMMFVPIELNSASDEDILAIPGVGPRMLHEFKEYRPYGSMAEFRREIGKYVDDDELTRLERYVTLEG